MPKKDLELEAKKLVALSKVGLRKSTDPTSLISPNIKKRAPRGKDFQEIGASGLEVYSGYIEEEFLPELRGDNAARVYREMMDNDSTVGAMLYAIEQLIQRTSLKIIIDGSDQDANRKKMLVSTALYDLNYTWQHTLSEILSSIPYGYAPMEVTLKQRSGYNRDPELNSKYNDGLIGWRGIELRSQESTDKWEIDEKGKIIAYWQQPPPTFKNIRIPMDKMLLFRPVAHKNSPEGKSLLRRAYRTFYFLKRLQEIEAIALERQLTGLPVITVPEGVDVFNPSDPDAAALLQRLEDIVRNIRVDQHMGVVLPFGYKLELMASTGKATFDTSIVIGRLEQRLAVTMLADMLLIGQDRVGSFALVTAKIQIFSQALQGLVKMIADEFNRYAIPRLMRANGFDQPPYPEMKFGPVETIDFKSLAEYINKLVGNQVLTPDDKLEEHVRQLAGFPERDETTERKPVQPQTGGSPFGGGGNSSNGPG